MPPARWILPEDGAHAAGQLAAELGIGLPAARVLAQRGFTNAPDARHFLEAPITSLIDPLELRDMDRAADRLACAIQTREPVLVFGDYDVDGSTSVALLMKTIEAAGGVASWRIPHRLKEGYGMREEAVEEAAREGVKLIVSVDTGIRAAAAVRRATELGVDVIITDHHLPEDELPAAAAVLNPNRADCTYPNKGLCGAGVAYKLALAALARLDWPADKLKRISDSFLKIVALATVADVAPLTGENRVIVRHGLAGLCAVRNPGLRALFEVAGFKPDQAPSARQVAFQIAPRINAAGRMDTARDVIELFLTSDAARARALAQQLHEQNAERQQVEAQIVECCLQTAVAETEAGLVYFHPDWHRGVLGIVASRMVERHHRPVFVLGLNEEDGSAQGSGRSIPGFHLLDALESMRDLFTRFGGHKHAAGVTLDAARVEEFRARFNACACARLTAEDFVPTVAIDALVELHEVDADAAHDVIALAPFGHGNPQPVFAAMGVELACPPVVWSGKHLKVTTRQQGSTLTLKAWNCAARIGEFTCGGPLDIAFTLEEDAFSAARGYADWCAILKDIRPAAHASQ